MKITPSTPVLAQLRELGRRIAEIRSQQGSSQEELAERAGIGVATLRRLETGSDTQFSSWLKILAALQMTDHLSLLVPEPLRSPAEDARKMKGRRRGGRAQLVAPELKGVGTGKQPVPRAKRVVWGDEQ